MRSMRHKWLRDLLKSSQLEAEQKFKASLLILKPVLPIPSYSDLTGLLTAPNKNFWLQCAMRNVPNTAPATLEKILSEQEFFHIIIIISLQKGQSNGWFFRAKAQAELIYLTCLLISSLMFSWVSGSVGIVAMLDQRRGFVTCFSITFPKSSCTCVKNTYRTRLLI